MVIVQNSDPKFHELLEVLCVTVQPPPFYSPGLSNYYSLATGDSVTNLSAIVSVEDEPISAFLINESHRQPHAKLDHFGNPAFFVTNESSPHSLSSLEEISAHYSSLGMRAKIRSGLHDFDIAMSTGILKSGTSFIESILRESKSLSPWILKKLDLQSLDTSLGTPEIDWPRTVKASLKQALNSDVSATVFDKNTQKVLLESAFWEFRHLHLLSAGRKTRPDSSWEEQLGAISRGHGFLVVAKSEVGIIGGAFFSLGFGSVYYGVAANHPDHSNVPIGHTILDKAARYSHAIGAKFFWSGQVLSEKYREVSAKEANIEKFKFGFGNSHSIYLRASRSS